MPLLDKAVKADHLELRFVTPFGDFWNKEGNDYASYDVLHKTMTYKGRLYPIDPKGIVFEKRILSIGPLDLVTLGNRPYMYVDTTSFQCLSWPKDGKKQVPAELLGELITERHALNFFRSGREKRLNKLLTIFATTSMILGIALMVAITLPYLVPMIQQAAKTIWPR